MTWREEIEAEGRAILQLLRRGGIDAVGGERFADWFNQVCDLVAVELALRPPKAAKPAAPVRRRASAKPGKKPGKAAGPRRKS
jgi:hypothetical protein